MHPSTLNDTICDLCVMGLEGELRFLLTSSNYGSNGMSVLFCNHFKQIYIQHSKLWLSERISIRD